MAADVLKIDRFVFVFRSLFFFFSRSFTTVSFTLPQFCTTILFRVLSDTQTKVCRIVIGLID